MSHRFCGQLGWVVWLRISYEVEVCRTEDPFPRWLAHTAVGKGPQLLPRRLAHLAIGRGPQLLPRWLAHRAVGKGSQLLAGCWQEPSVPHPVDLLTGLLRVS